MNDWTLSKRWFLKSALSYLGTPYIWGGDDPSGFDCSGFVVECLKTAGFLSEKEDHTADGLLHKYKDYLIKYPREGALIFRLNDKDHAEHVAICLDHQFKIEAKGGNSLTTTLSSSWHDNAFVKIRPIYFNNKSHRVVYLFGD